MKLNLTDPPKSKSTPLPETWSLPERQRSKPRLEPVTGKAPARKPSSKEGPDYSDTGGLLTVEASAQYLGISVSHLYTLRYSGAVTIPIVKLPSRKLGAGKLVHYRKRDLDAFINSCAKD